VNIWQSYQQQRGCLVHFARLANTLLKDEESARDNHVLAYKFAKYLPIKKNSVGVDSPWRLKQRARVFTDGAGSDQRAASELDLAHGEHGSRTLLGHLSTYIIPEM